MEPELEKNSIILVTELDKELSDLVMDSEQIYQVFLNMIFNAIQALPEGGTITIRTGKAVDGDGHTAFFSITDTGVGMSEEKTTQIFTPFYTDKNKGTGLGLAIAKNIIEKHHGRVHISSEENLGSTFTVHLKTGTV
jgi:signal transduction histidine kinase